MVKPLWLPVHAGVCVLMGVLMRMKSFWQEFCCSSCQVECGPAALMSLARTDLRSASATLWLFIANSTESRVHAFVQRFHWIYLEYLKHSKNIPSWSSVEEEKWHSFTYNWSVAKKERFIRSFIPCCWNLKNLWLSGFECFRSGYCIKIN